MGLGKWTARRGAVGSTARWAGENFVELQRKEPSITVADACLTLIAIRTSVGVGYSDMGKQLLLNQANEGINSLQELVRCVLSVEVGQDFDDVWWDMAPLYQDVISEELKKKGVPTSAI